jgi:hypothetical protein
MSHADMVREGATRYVARLRAASIQARARDVADRVIETIEAALREGPALDVDDVPFTQDDLVGLTEAERANLRNSYLPGYGDPEARLLLIGTEHAFDFERPRRRGPSPEACFAVADCALHALWLADGSEAEDILAEHVSGQAPHCGETFALHRHPYEYLYPVPSGHMWRRLSRMMLAAGVALDRCASPMWGTAAYMFEMSETASADQGHGALPSAERQAFLKSIIGSMVEARVLVFHGRWKDVDWDGIRTPLAHEFIGDASATWTSAASGDYRSAVSLDGNKLAVFMQSPTRRGRTNAFLDAVGSLIRPYLVSSTSTRL